MKQAVGLRSLLKFRGLADELAQLTNEYLEKGYTPHEITRTIADMLLHQLYMRLTSDATRLMPRGGHNQPTLDKDTAVELFSLDFSSALMAAMSDRIAKRRK